MKFYSPLPRTVLNEHMIDRLIKFITTKTGKKMPVTKAIEFLLEEAMYRIDTDETFFLPEISRKPTKAASKSL